MKKVEGDRCLVFVPEGSGSHPVLCFLHGAGEAGADRNGKPQSLATVLKNGSPAWHAEKGSAFMSRFLSSAHSSNAGGDGRAVMLRGSTRSCRQPSASTVV